MPENSREDYYDNLEYAELNKQDQDAFINTNIDFQRWLVDPEARKKFDDINKDMLTSYLQVSDITSIKLMLDCLNGATAIRQLLEGTADIILPQKTFHFLNRKVSSLLALANSKDGFRLKIMNTKTLQKVSEEYKEEPKKEKSGGLNFLKKKEKTSE